MQPNQINKDEYEVEVAVNHSRQLFDDKDPTPFRDPNLDQNFVSFLINSVQAIPLKKLSRLRIIIKQEVHSADEKNILEAINSYFTYEAQLMQIKKRKSTREGRIFLLLGLLTLFSCLSLSQMLETILVQSKLMLIIQEGFVIIGWVAMWRPLEMFLYDWWPLHEQEGYFKKIAEMDKEINFIHSTAS